MLKLHYETSMKYNYTQENDYSASSIWQKQEIINR